MRTFGIVCASIVGIIAVFFAVVGLVALFKDASYISVLKDVFNITEKVKETVPETDGETVTTIIKSILHK